jgi:hypothetical protein
MLENHYKKGSERRLASVVVLFIFLICILHDYKYIATSPVFTPDELIPPKAVNWTKEHLPTGVDINNIDKHGQKIIMTAGGESEILAWNSVTWAIKTDAKKDALLRIRSFYFPGWKAYIDGIQTEIRKEKDSGAMLVTVPGGMHTLEMTFRDTPVRYYSKLITIFSLLFIVILCVILSVRVHTITRKGKA